MTFNEKLLFEISKKVFKNHKPVKQSVMKLIRG